MGKQFEITEVAISFVGNPEKLEGDIETLETRGFALVDHLPVFWVCHESPSDVWKFASTLVDSNRAAHDALVELLKADYLIAYFV